MKFIHAADLHIDSPLVGLSGRDDAPLDEIRSATRRAYRNLVVLAIDEAVDFVVLAGDIFDGDWPDYHTGLFFNRGLSDLNQAHIPVFLVSGNHDAASTISRHLTLPPNVVRFSTDRAQTERLDALKVAIHGQGFRERDVRENLVPGYPTPVPGYFNVGILHTSVDGQGGHETYAPCRLTELVDKGYDYWALGHIHRRQILHEDPWVVYAGNLQGRHIRETGAKGAMLVTVDKGGGVTVEFRPLDVLRWVMVSVHLDPVGTYEQLASLVHARIQEAMTPHLDYPVAMRVRFEGTTLLHGSLVADSERLLMEVENAGTVVAPGRVWIEQIDVGTRPLSDHEAPPPDDARREVKETMRQLSEDELFLGETQEALIAVLNHLGPQWHQEQEDWLSKDSIRQWLHDAEELLVTRLGEGGLS